MANHSLDEFIKNESSCANENANNQAYYPNYELLQRNESIGIPDFKRYASRKNKNAISYDVSVDSDTWARGKDMTLKAIP